MLADQNQSEKKVTFYGIQNNGESFEKLNKFGIEDKQQTYLQAISKMPQ